MDISVDTLDMVDLTTEISIFQVRKKIIKILTHFNMIVFSLLVPLCFHGIYGHHL